MSSKPTVLRFKFDNFESFRGDEVVCSERKVDDKGNAWKLQLYPGGEDSDSEEDPSVGLYLQNVRLTSVTAKAAIILRDAAGDTYQEYEMKTNLYKPMDPYGYVNFIERSELLDEENKILVDGALCIDVHIQTKPPPGSLHVPLNPFATNMLKLLEDEEEADVSFLVKRTTIPAHRLILKMNAPTLYEFCEEQEEGKNIPIKDTTPAIFRILLRYVYGGDVPDAVTIDTAKDLIIAADKYNVSGLKLTVETTLVGALMLDRHNVVEWLQFADSMTLPLLKEHAMSYCVSRAENFVGSEWSEELQESPKLMNEYMKEISSGLVKDPRFDKSSRNMSVNELRKNLHEKGLDVDGTKEMLASRLQESNKRQRVE